MLLSLLVYLHAGGPCAIVLREWRDEVHVESLLKEILSLALELSQAKEGHSLQVLLGTVQQNLISLLLRHDRQIVASHQAEVREHADLAVVGQIVRTIHELLQGTA